MNFMASLYGIGLFNRGRLHRLLKFVELDEHKDKLVRNLSGGMMRRLSLAATLIPDPKLIFLDEPTAGIDPVLRQKFWERFKEIRDEGKTLFITTQYVGEVTYCDLVGVMDKGRLLMVDTPAGIRYRVYGGDMIDLETKEPIHWERVGELERLPFVRDHITVVSENHMRLLVDEARTAIPDLMEWGGRTGVEINSVEEFLPPFDDVFVHLITKEDPHV
jgi:ABC-2 type transport system ATP-binding protein